MSEHRHKAHHVSALLYYTVYPTKCLRAVISHEVEEAPRRVCFDSGNRYYIPFSGIGAEGCTRLETGAVTFGLAR